MLQLLPDGQPALLECLSVSRTPNTSFPHQIKKSRGMRSGERGGYCTGPPLPIERLGKTLFRYSLTSRAKCAGAPSCWNHRCLTFSGTFSNISGNMSRIKIMSFPNISNNFCKTILRQTLQGPLARKRRTCQIFVA